MSNRAILSLPFPTMTDVLQMTDDEYLAHLHAVFDDQSNRQSPAATIGEVPAQEALFFKPYLLRVDPLFNKNRYSAEARLRCTEVLQAYLAPNTVTTYGTGVRNYVSWCESIGLRSSQYLPAPEDLLVMYVCHLAGVYVKSTARNYLSAVCAWHLLHGGD
jgi:hypothetical protein